MRAEIVIDYDLIAARLGELDIDAREFAHRTGVQQYYLEARTFTPDRMSVALLIRIAAVLDVGVEDLLTNAQPGSAAASNTTTATDAPEPARPSYRDDQIAEMVLVRYGGFRLEELAGVLRWTPYRTQAALESLRARWENGPLRLSGTVDDLGVGVRAGALDPGVRDRIQHRRHDLTPLMPREAEYLLALVRDDILRPVASGPANLPHFTGQDDLLARGLIEVHGEDDQITQWPAARQAPTADFLFGLGLLATPTR